MARTSSNNSGGTHWGPVVLPIVVSLAVSGVGVAVIWGGLKSNVETTASEVRRLRDADGRFDERLDRLETQRAGDAARMTALTERINAAIGALFERRRSDDGNR